MKRLIITISFIYIYTNTFSQNFNNYTDNGFRKTFRIMFYNAENFFDTKHDSSKNDYQFLPDGDKHWTLPRYQEKLTHISRVITAIGGWQPPEIIGLCEVENRNCVNDLVEHSDLKKLNYKIIHKESPDKRGIDVVFLYQDKKFTPVYHEFIRIDFPNNSRKTRDIIYVKGYTDKHDTLNIFVNHWPSRWGGQLASEPKRIYVASVLRKKVDSLIAVEKNPNIIIMGDLNDMPFNISVTKVLKANSDIDKTTIYADSLYNLAGYFGKKIEYGSHKYHGEWGILDQIIVTGNLMLKTDKIYTTKNDYHIFNADFLTEKDEKYFGLQPYRTYIGFKYHGGYSDHFPVFIDLYETR